MQPRRIILANRPRLLREMLRRVIDRNPDLEIVGEIHDLTKSSNLIQQTDADWIIVSFSPSEGVPADAKALLHSHPSVSVLAVSRDGSRVRMRWVKAQEKVLDGLTLADLIELLHKRSSELYDLP